MEARESKPPSAERHLSLRRVLLRRIVPALIVMAAVAAYAWHIGAHYVLPYWLITVGCIAAVTYATVKRYRTDPHAFDLEYDTASGQTMWRTLLTGGLGYLTFLVGLDEPWVLIVRIAIRIHRLYFDR